MQNSFKYSFCALALLVITLGSAHATPSTQIWNPSTDIQAKGTFHLTYDTYLNDSLTLAYYGVEYGAFKNFEVGFDLNMNQYAGAPSANAYPLYFNAKYGLPEGEAMPALAGGVMSVGTKKTETDEAGTQINGTDLNIFFAVVAKTFSPVGRFSVGGYSGNDKLLLDETGAKANSGAILSWDKALTGKVWACVDYASGNSSYGFLSLGGSYAFASNTSVILGYLIPNNYKVNTAGNQFTVQLDVNF